MPTLTSAHDLITAVPFLLGFTPTNSLVLISVKGDSASKSIGMAMRIDLPSSLHSDEIDLLAHHLIRDGADEALLLAYMPDERGDGDSILIALSAGLMRSGIATKESIVVSGGRYRSIICRDPSCCSPAGTSIPAIEESRFAAEHVVAGIPMPYGDISELIGSIAADEESMTRSWAQLVAGYEVDEENPNLPALRRDGVEALELLADEFRIGRGPTDRKLVARVIGRMSDVQVRDYALGIHGEDTFDLYFTMWRELLRLAPPSFVAPIACVVGAMAYEGGDGALAHKALDRAVADDERYPLAALLRRVFNAGWPPESFAQMRAELHPKVIVSIYGE